MLNKDQLFLKGLFLLVMGKKHCTVMICLILKQEILMCKANVLKCQVHE